jgi:hypothetical protein
LPDEVAPKVIFSNDRVRASNINLIDDPHLHGSSSGSQDIYSVMGRMNPIVLIVNAREHIGHNDMGFRIFHDK